MFFGVFLMFNSLIRRVFIPRIPLSCQNPAPTLPTMPGDEEQLQATHMEEYSPTLWCVKLNIQHLFFFVRQLIIGRVAVWIQSCRKDDSSSQEAEQHPRGVSVGRLIRRSNLLWVEFTSRRLAASSPKAEPGDAVGDWGDPREEASTRVMSDIINYLR